MSAAPFDPLVSVFPSATDADTVAHLSLSALMVRIRGDELADISQRIRESFTTAGGGKEGKRAVEAAKRKLPAVTLAGTFDRRVTAAWRVPSGLVQFDLDHLDTATMAKVRRTLMDHPWVACLWASPSGAGLKGAVRVPDLAPDPTAYRKAWLAVARWLESLGMVNDPAAKDCARLAFLAHDPDAWHNESAEAFHLDRWTCEEPPLAKRPHAVVPVFEVEKRALAHVRAMPGSEQPEGWPRSPMAYVRAMPDSVQGANGSAAMMAVVRVLRDGFDLDGAPLWSALETWNAERADPPWNRAELEHAVGSVEREASTHGRGWLLRHNESGPRAELAPWSALEPLGRASDPPLFDSATMLPCDVPWLLRFVEGVAEAVQVPGDLVASAAVGLASLASARSVEVECAPGWKEPAPLWVVALLRPGERKSASMSILARPFHDWTARERQAMAEPLARYLERRRVMEARLSAVRNKAAKEAKPEARKKLETEALDLAADLEAMPARVSAPDLLVQSFTPEGLRDALEANGEKLGIVSAEADAGELLGARYSDAGPNLDLMLCAHAGDPITTRRAGGRTVPLLRPALGMVLAVQPEAVRTVLNDRAAKGRGLVDRMLLIHPSSRMGNRLLDPPVIAHEVAQWWSDSVHAILDHPWPGRVIIGHDGEPVRCTSEPRTLPIDTEARRHLWELRATLEPRLGEGGDLANVSGFASKLPGACARLALAFTMLRDPRAAVVGAEAMRAACSWAPYLLAHHRAVLGDAVEPPERHHARRLWRALQRRGRPVMTARDLFKLVLDSAMPDKDAFAPVLALLVDHGAVRPLPRDSSAQGRPAERFAIHPAILPAMMSDESDRSGSDGRDSSDLSDTSHGREGAA